MGRGSLDIRALFEGMKAADSAPYLARWPWDVVFFLVPKQRKFGGNARDRRRARRAYNRKQRAAALWAW